MTARLIAYLNLCLVLCAFLTACSVPNTEQGRSRDFNADWRFLRDSVKGAETPSYDDSSWQQIDLPHDYSLMDLPGEDTDEQVGPFTTSSPGGNHTGFVLGGTGWYRKTFTTSKNDEGKSFTLMFDGAYMETEVWVNGQSVGNHKNGYTPFAYDITAALRPAGEENIIAVRTDNKGRNSRWYSGSGLYRDVQLIVTHPVHVATWGVYIQTPEVSVEKADIHIELALQNDTPTDVPADIDIHILDKNKQVITSTTVHSTLSASVTQIQKASLTITEPLLWSTDTPNLYEAKIEIKQDGNIVDTYIQSFGIRTLEFTADRGFLLNGEPLLLRGACLHHDNGFLGAATIHRAEERRVELMKANGYNAIRCSHNPPSTAFLNACDELGILVIDEFTDMWNLCKNPNDYARFFDTHWEDDLTDMIQRDRNHPSIIMWSIGNEIPKMNIEEGTRIGAMLAAKVRELDSTRAITEGVPSFLIHGGWANTYEYFANLDVCGYNYTQFRYEEDHAQYPNRIMYASEAYPSKAYKGWKLAEKHPYVIGEFVWTALDYIGEVGVADSKYVSTIDSRSMQDRDGIPEGTDPRRIFDLMQMYSTSKWPEYLSWCGDLDILGEKKPQGRYRDVLWDRSPIEICVHEPIPAGMQEAISAWGWPKEVPSWNWKGHEGELLQVRVFTKAPVVQLELNGKLIGEHILKETDEYIASFVVPYEEGTLTAISLKDGKEIARQSLITTGSPSAIRLTADRTTLRATRQDLSFIRIDIVDTMGRLVPTADNIIEIEVKGVGEMAASGNADPYGMSSANRSKLRVFQGQAQVVIRPLGTPGTINLRIYGEEVGEKEISILVQTN